jgi:hypothetical protein
VAASNLPDFEEFRALAGNVFTNRTEGIKIQKRIVQTLAVFKSIRQI